MESVCRIKVIEGPGKGVCCAFSNGAPILFGRHESNDSIIGNDPAISRRHFQIYYQHGQWWLCDSGSRNGTFVNNSLVVQTMLHDQDVIGVGNTKMAVRLMAESARQLVPPTQAQRSTDQASRYQKSGQTLRDTSIDLPRAESPGSLVQRLGGQTGPAWQAAANLAASRSNPPGSASANWIKPPTRRERHLELLDLPTDFVLSTGMSQLLMDLPGTAFLLNGIDENSSGLLQEMDSIPALNQSRLLFPRRSAQIQRLLANYWSSNQLFVLVHTLRKSVLASRVQLFAGIFATPQKFWSEIESLPNEVTQGAMQGIEMIACPWQADPQQPAIFRAALMHRAESELIQDLVTAVQTRAAG